MSPAGRPGTFERVYAAIKGQLRNGLFRPGDRLEPAALADELNASVTPIRDALHRLTGERLIEAPRHEGFRVPLMTETTLRHLYAWHRDLLVLAILSRWTSERFLLTDQVLPDAANQSESQNALFFMLGRLTGNPEVIVALEAVTERLGPVQRLEEALLDAISDETDEIAEALRSADRSRLRRALVRYHRRRERIVPDLLDRLYRLAGKPADRA
jgi:DNA-binding GntR family transcriptional regulator